MNRTILRFEIQHGGYNGIDLPLDAKILSFGKKEDDSLHMWVEVPQCFRELKEKTRLFCIFGTGFDIPPNHTYIGTAVDSGEFVWHLYEKNK